MKIRHITLTISPDSKNADRIYIGVDTNVKDFPHIITFEQFLDYLNKTQLRNVNLQDMEIISKGYVIDGNKLNIKHPEIQDPAIIVAEDFIYVRAVEGVGLILKIFAYETTNFKKNVFDGQLIGYDISLDSQNSIITLAIDKYLTMKESTTIGNIWEKYFLGTGSDPKKKLITKLFNKL